MDKDHERLPNTDKSDYIERPFRTPAQISADKADEVLELPEEPAKSGLTTKKIHKRLWARFKGLSRRRKIIIIVIAIIVLAAIVVGIVLSMHKPAKPVGTLKKTQLQVTVAKPTTVASDLTGLQVDPSINNRPVTGIMIENSDAARPQSGLTQAGVVFEAIAEGGVTRFLALFQDTQPTYIGPVRSLRPYYLSWDMGFDAPIAHVGGSPDALSDLKSWGGKDLDEFYNAGAYQRISSRQAPHNVYTSISQLNALETTKGWTKSSYTSFLRKGDAPSKDPTATSIDLTLSGYDYNAHYDYNASTNSYNRSEAGAAMTDQQSGAQISPKVVIAMVIPLSQGALDASGAYYSDYNYLGTGPVAIFQDGTSQTGTWTKSSNTSQIQFKDANGNPIRLDAGQTWITAVGSSSDISSK
jgi:hypothetical protein